MRVGEFLFRVILPNSTKASHIYGSGYYGAKDQCTADLSQRRKPMGAGLSVNYEYLVRWRAVSSGIACY